MTDGAKCVICTAPTGSFRQLTCGFYCTAALQARQDRADTPRPRTLLEIDEQAERDAEDYEGWTEVDFQEACNPNQGAK